MIRDVANEIYFCYAPRTMPRQARLDAPNVLHHVMVRGIERTAVFRDDRDHADFVARVAALAEAGAWTVYAWALVGNHAHLLVRTGTRPLARSMRSLLTGYAGAFNRRHGRRGHLFQNRYKSVVVEEEPYLLELVRYVHLNPLRAGRVRDLAALARYPWSGHSALLGRVPRPWQATAPVLGCFGRSGAPARRAYTEFVAAGIPQGRRPELQGGGLVRSAGGWAAVQALRRGREAYLSDERVLGSAEFVEAVRHAVAHGQPARRVVPLPVLLQRICGALGLDPAALATPSRRRVVAQARAGLAYLWVTVLGQPGRALATALGLCPQAVYQAVPRGATEAAR
jgi:REP element-mobilizing transposase RayT